MKGKMYLWRGGCINEAEDVFMKGKMYLWRGRCIYEGKLYLWKVRCIYEAKMCLWRGRCIYEGKMYLWRARCILIADINKFREFLKEKSERNVWESVLAKNPGFFEPFATARFYNSKGKRRCADSTFVTDAVRAQISIKKSRIFMRNGKGKPPVMKGKMYLWSEDAFMKGKMYLWSGRCIYEREDVFMKGKMYLWSEDVFMKGKMYLWRGRCIYEGKMYLWREKKKSWNFWRNWK